MDGRPTSVGTVRSRLSRLSPHDTFDLFISFFRALSGRFQGYAAWLDTFRRFCNGFISFWNNKYTTAFLLYAM